MLIYFDEDDILEDYLEAGVITIIKLGTTTCPPCQMLKPIFEKLSVTDGFEDMNFLDVNAIDHEELMIKFKAEAVPTIIYFRGIELVGKTTGFIPFVPLKNFITQIKDGNL